RHRCRPASRLTASAICVGCGTLPSTISNGGIMADHGGLMAGKRGLVMGVANDRSIAWGIARTVAAHGAELAFTYQGEALEKRVRPLADQLGAKLVLPCDVADDASLDATFKTIEE